MSGNMIVVKKGQAEAGQVCPGRGSVGELIGMRGELTGIAVQRGAQAPFPAGVWWEDGELLGKQRCWVLTAGSEAAAGDMARDLINLLCSGGAEILQELCQGLRLVGPGEEGFSSGFFLGWLVGMGIEVSELGQECAYYSGINFKNKEERTVKMHGGLCVYWAYY